MSTFTKTIGAGLVAALALGGASTAFASAIIINPAGTVAIGVDDLGQLNVDTGNVTSNASATGVAYKFADGSFRDATAPGCLCEGWGVSVNGTTSGYANNANATGGLTQTNFASTSSTASVTTALTSLTGLTVTHDFVPATTASSTLYRAHVTITNTTGAAVNDLKYVRVMDWDVPPTEFSEYVTIKGTATTTFLELSHDDGFESSDPLASTDEINLGTTNVDFTDSGPNDHGAYFRFNFGTLADNAKFEFDIFYGAAGTERAALLAIGQEGIELYSLGQSNGNQIDGDPATFIFGFKGVGGTPVEPPTGVPEPGTLVLAGLAMVGLWRSRRQQK